MCIQPSTANIFDKDTYIKRITDKVEEKTCTSITVINMTERKYYVYTQMGILINRFEFGEYVEKYGEVVCVSNNG